MSEKLIREIKRRMPTFGLTPITLAAKAGLGRDAVRDILRGKSLQPSHATVTAIAKALACTAADMTGERTPAPRPRALTDVVSVNELDVHTRSGLGPDSDSTLMQSDEATAIIGVHMFPTGSFRESFGINPERVKIIAVRGDSMEPKFWPGQRVIVDITDTTPSPPGVFVVWDGLGLAIKRVEVLAGTDPLRVRISSANPAYLPYEVLYSESAINGRVIGVWART